jgi:pyridoxine 5-phosphate synthase
MNKLLGVNIDHVATLRQARGVNYPDPLEAAEVAVKSGADKITFHLREDRRHIQDLDVHRLKHSINAPLNFECAATDEIIEIVTTIKPDRCMIVPEKREELSTEGGLDVIKWSEKLAIYIDKLHTADIAISLFIDANNDHIEAAHKMGVKFIELHTGHYCHSVSEVDIENELSRLKDATQFALAKDIEVSAGHGLTIFNLARLVDEIPDIVEYNIGHSIVARSVFIGFENAVKEVKDILTRRTT